MNRWRTMCGVITSLIVVIILVISLIGSPFMHHNLKNQVNAYLKENGISAEQIVELKTHYQRNGEPAYFVECHRNDTEEVHWYAFNSEGHIQEIQP